MVHKAPRPSQKWVAEVDGREVARSETPFLDACRALLAEGTDPEAMAGMFRAGDTEPSLSGKVGVAAGLMVSGSYFKTYNPKAPREDEP